MKSIMHWGRRELVEQQVYTYATQTVYRVPVTLAKGVATPAADLDRVLQDWNARPTPRGAIGVPTYNLACLVSDGGRSWAVIEMTVDHGE